MLLGHDLGQLVIVPLVHVVLVLVVVLCLVDVPLRGLALTVWVVGKFAFVPLLAETWI